MTRRSHFREDNGSATSRYFTVWTMSADYARGRFGGSHGEIHVYDVAGQNIIEKIQIDGGKQYGHPQQ